MFFFFLILRPFGTTTIESPSPHLPVESPKKTSGMLFHHSASGDVYLFLDGKFRHVPNPETFNALFAVPLDCSFMRSCQDIKEELKGKPLVRGATLVKGCCKKIYLIDEEDDGRIVKRHIVDESVFALFKFNWSKVLCLSAAADCIPIGRDIDHENLPEL